MNSTMQEKHETVLLHEAVEALAIEPTDTIVDATFGAGGHAKEALSRLGEQGHYIGIDIDETALGHPLNELGNVTLLQGNFRELKNLLASADITQVDGVMADLGWRMEHFSGNGKGFSFRLDEPLLMTLGDPEVYPFTARDIVNEWDEAVVADIIFGYSEDRFARRIAKRIVEARSAAPIETSMQRADIVYQAVPAVARRGKIHPATKTFQALRIAVNEELQVLEEFIANSLSVLKPGGRLAIITFHSLEDRIVKHVFRQTAQEEQGTVLTKKPIVPSSEELAENPRARSAKLRIFQKQ